MKQLHSFHLTRCPFAFELISLSYVGDHEIRITLSEFVPIPLCGWIIIVLVNFFPMALVYLKNEINEFRPWRDVMATSKVSNKTNVSFFEYWVLKKLRKSEFIVNWISYEGYIRFVWNIQDILVALRPLCGWSFQSKFSDLILQVSQCHRRKIHSNGSDSVSQAHGGISA